MACKMIQAHKYVEYKGFWIVQGATDGWHVYTPWELADFTDEHGTHPMGWHAPQTWRWIAKLHQIWIGGAAPTPVREDVPHQAMIVIDDWLSEGSGFLPWFGPHDLAYLEAHREEVPILLAKFPQSTQLKEILYGRDG